MELEALRQEKADSEVGGKKSLAAALEEQTRVLKEALSSRGSSSTVTAVKTDLSWPTLGTRELTRRMSRSFMRNLKMFVAREKLLALRARCKGSRLKTYQNLYLAAWQSGEVLEDPEAVYERIKSKHLLNRVPRRTRDSS